MITKKQHTKQDVNTIADIGRCIFQMGLNPIKLKVHIYLFEINYFNKVKREYL